MKYVRVHSSSALQGSVAFKEQSGENTSCVDVTDSAFFVKKIVGYYSAKILDIDKLSDLMTITRMEELLRDVMTRKTLLGRMAPTDDDENDYLISLKKRWLKFIKFNVKRWSDNIEIADKIKGHDPDVVRDIYVQTVMTPLNEKTEQFFSEILDVYSQKIRSDTRGT